MAIKEKFSQLNAYKSEAVLANVLKRTEREGQKCQVRIGIPRKESPRVTTAIEKPDFSIRTPLSFLISCLVWNVPPYNTHRKCFKLWRGRCSAVCEDRDTLDQYWELMWQQGQRVIPCNCIVTPLGTRSFMYNTSQSLLFAENPFCQAIFFFP